MAAPHSAYPRTDFPEDLECHPLLVVDYAKVAAGDDAEIDTLWKACTTIGFFYLKNHGVEDLTEPMFKMGEDTFSQPLEDLLPFEQGDSGMSAGYKRAGSTNVDAKVRWACFHYSPIVRVQRADLAFSWTGQRGHGSVHERGQG